MALIKGKFIDPSLPIQQSQDPVAGDDVARKSYVDTKSEGDASAAESAANSYTDTKLGELVPDGLLPMAVLFGTPDGLGIDRSEFLTYDASIGLMLNVGGQLQTRSLAQGANDPSSVILNDKLEVLATEVDGSISKGRITKDLVESIKITATAQYNASMGWDGVDSWMGVSKTENAGNDISMIKLFPHKAQLFTVDLGAGTGPQPIMPVEQYDLAVKKYVDDEAAAAQSAAQLYADGIVSDLADIVQGNFDLQQSDIDGLRSDVDALAINKQDSLGTGTTSQFLRGDLTWQEIVTTVAIAQQMHVSKNGSDVSGSGTLDKPFASIGAAMAAISDASPTKRYVIKVAPGAYTEGALALKANVFIVGEHKDSVRVTASSVALDSSFSGSADNRSGIARLILTGAATFNWTTVTSAAGKLYFNEVSFSSAVSMTGYNNAIAQAQVDSCMFFGTLTVSGINLGVYQNNLNYGMTTLNQHPTGGMVTWFVANGSRMDGGLTINATTNDFNRRCSAFLYSSRVGSLTINGPSAYCDVTIDSLPLAGATTTNGGNLVHINKHTGDLETGSIISKGMKPDIDSSRYLGDWGKQFLFAFNYVNASSGTDLYLTTYGSSYGPDSAGKSIYITPDGAGLQTNANSGDIVLETAAVTGTGVRGKIVLNAKEIDASSVKIVSLADGTAPADAVNKGQLDSVASAAESYADSKVEDQIVEGVTDKAPSQDAVYQAIQSAIQAADQSPYKESKVLTATDISNGYVDLTRAAMANSMMVSVSGTVQYEDEDYSLSTVGGVTRVTFLGDLTPDGDGAALVEGDKVHFHYWAPVEV